MKIDVSAPPYNAQGNDTDDTAAIVAAAGAAGNGDLLWFPKNAGKTGRYKCSSTLSFNSKSRFDLAGEHGAVLEYTGAGLTPFISMQSCDRPRILDLGIEYSNVGFAAPLVFFDKLAPNQSQPDTFQPIIEGSKLSGVGGIQSASTLVALGGSICGALRDVTLEYAKGGIRGRRNADDYSNAFDFENVTFAGLSFYGAKNAGSAWTFDNCIFEALTGGVAGGYTYDTGLDSYTNAFASAGPNALAFKGCWFGDATAMTGTWINFAGAGLDVAGSHFENSRGINVNAIAANGTFAGRSSDGIVVKGNDFWYFTTGIEFSGAVGERDLNGNAWHPEKVAPGSVNIKLNGH